MTGEKVSGVIVYVIRDNSEVLFMKRSGGQYARSWWPVAGTREMNETPRECAIRELREETGLAGSDLLDFGIQIPHYSGNSALEVYVYNLARGDTIQLNYEHSSFRWMSAKEALASVPQQSQVYIQHLIDHFLTNTQHPEN